MQRGSGGRHCILVWSKGSPSSYYFFSSFIKGRTQAMSFSVAANCPFLGRVSTSFLQNSGTSLGMYGQKCPVMSKLFHTAVNGTRSTVGKKGLNLGEFKLFRFLLL